MHTLKMKVRNKARVEGSICEAYLLEVISNFSSMYFEPQVRTRLTRPPRNDEGGDDLSDDNRLSIFKTPGRAFGSSWYRMLEDRELEAAELYILLNCAETEPYIE